MKISQVAVGLFTVRDYLKTPADVSMTLHKIREIGYQAVELSGLGPIAVNDIAKLLVDVDLFCCSTHEDSKKLLSEPNPIVQQLRKLNCRYTAYPYPSGADLTTLAGIKILAAHLNAVGKVFADAGLVFTYHNHDIEFRRVEGRCVLDVIYEETDPRYLQGQIDTYWVQHGGGNTEAWCRKLHGRLPLLHMKDYVISANNEPSFAEIGYGNLDWSAIIKAAEVSGCEWYIVEQDICAGDPFDSLRLSFEYIRDNLPS